MSPAAVGSALLRASLDSALWIAMQGELGRMQGQLGAQQGSLGTRQGELGRMQAKVSQQIARELRAQCQKWIDEGRAEAVR